MEKDEKSFLNTNVEYKHTEKKNMSPIVVMTLVRA